MRLRPCWGGAGLHSEVESVEEVCELAGAHTGAGGLCVQDLPEWTAPQPGVQHVSKFALLTERAPASIKFAADLRSSWGVEDSGGPASAWWGCGGRSPCACRGRSQSRHGGGFGPKGLLPGNAPHEEVFLQFIPGEEGVAGRRLAEQLVVPQAGCGGVPREEPTYNCLVLG